MSYINRKIKKNWYLLSIKSRPYYYYSSLASENFLWAEIQIWHRKPNRYSSMHNFSTLRNHHKFIYWTWIVWLTNTFENVEEIKILEFRNVCIWLRIWLIRSYLLGFSHSSCFTFLTLKFSWFLWCRIWKA